MYCPKCGTKLPDVAKFCTKCGRPLPKPAEPTREALVKPLPQVELPPTAPSIVEAVSPGVEPVRPSPAEQMEAAPPPAEQPRVQVPSIAPDLRALSRQVDLLLTGLGTLVVLLAFFLSWFHVSSPLANVFFAGLVAFDMSGRTILVGFPDFGLPGSPIVVVVPLLALGTLAISLLSSRVGILGRKSSIVQIVVGLLGIGFMLVTLLGVQDLYENAFRRLGLPPMVGQKIISLDPAIGFWLTLLGFILVIGGAIWTWQRSQ